MFVCNGHRNLLPPGERPDMQVWEPHLEGRGTLERTGSDTMNSAQSIYFPTEEVEKGRAEQIPGYVSLWGLPCLEMLRLVTHYLLDTGSMQNSWGYQNTNKASHPTHPSLLHVPQVRLDISGQTLAVPHPLAAWGQRKPHLHPPWLHHLISWDFSMKNYILMLCSGADVHG